MSYYFKLGFVSLISFGMIGLPLAEAQNNSKAATATKTDNTTKNKKANSARLGRIKRGNREVKVTSKTESARRRLVKVYKTKKKAKSLMRALATIKKRIKSVKKRIKQKAARRVLSKAAKKRTGQSAVRRLRRLQKQYRKKAARLNRLNKKLFSLVKRLRALLAKYPTVHARLKKTTKGKIAATLSRLPMVEKKGRGIYKYKG